LKIDKGGNDSLSHECKEEIQVIFHKSMDLLTSSILNNNKSTLIRKNKHIKEKNNFGHNSLLGAKA
jgi:hypothetical protein